MRTSSLVSLAALTSGLLASVALSSRSGLAAGEGEAAEGPACRIRGRVADAGPDVARWVIVARIAPAGTVAARATVDANGRFLLAGLQPGEYRISPELPQDAERTAAGTNVGVSREHPEAEVVLRARPGGLLVGRTVDEATREPLAEVRVAIQSPHSLVDAQLVTSGTDGRFRFRVPPGRCRIGLAVPNAGGGGEGLAYLVNASVGEGREVPVEVPVKGWLALDGKVVDARGRPAAGARVQVIGLAADPASITAGAGGTFRLAGVAGASVTLHARGDEDDLGALLTLKPPFPKAVRLEMGALPRITLVGRVVDDRGRPVPGVPVRLRAEGDGPPLDRGRDRATTSKDGRYRLVTHDAASRFSALVDGGGHYSLGGGEWLGDGGAERRLADLVVVSSGASVSGRVRGRDGRPAAGVAVFWVSGLSGHRAATDTEGRFRIDGLPDRPVVLAARGTGRGSALARATPGREAVLTLR